MRVTKMMKTMGGFEKTKEVEADWGGGQNLANRIRSVCTTYVSNVMGVCVRMCSQLSRLEMREFDFAISSLDHYINDVKYVMSRC